MLYTILFLVYSIFPKFAVSSSSELDAPYDPAPKQKVHPLENSIEKVDYESLEQIHKTYPELEYQYRFSLIETNHIKYYLSLMNSPYFIQRIRVVYYFRSLLRRHIPIPLDWVIADISLRSKHFCLKKLSTSYLDYISKIWYHPYRYNAAISLWESNNRAIQQSVIKTMLSQNKQHTLCFSDDKWYFQTVCQSILYNCHFIINYSTDIGIQKKCVKKINKFIFSIFFPSAFFLNTEKNNDLTEMIQSKSGDLFIANIYAHYLNLYYQNRHILGLIYHNDKNKFDRQSFIKDIQKFFKTLHRSQELAKHRFKDFYQLNFEAFKDLSSFWEQKQERHMEAETGIEPISKDLQSSA